MSVIEQAWRDRDIPTLEAEAHRLKLARIRAHKLQAAEDEQAHRIMDHIGRTNPAAIDRMLAVQS